MQMDNITAELVKAIGWLQEAHPLPGKWSGQAATRCSLAIDELAAEIRAADTRLKMNLGEAALNYLGSTPIVALHFAGKI